MGRIDVESWMKLVVWLCACAIAFPAFGDIWSRFKREVRAVRDRSSARSERLLDKQEAIGSNPIDPTIPAARSLARFLEEEYGRECDEFAYGCPVCQAWEIQREFETWSRRRS